MRFRGGAAVGLARVVVVGVQSFAQTRGQVGADRIRTGQFRVVVRVDRTGHQVRQ